MNKTKVIAAFPGCGKSNFTNNNEKLLVSDSDSSKFDKSAFPGNYIEHITQRISDNYDIVFVSSHDVVRNALIDSGIDFILVYPHISLKDEYIERYKQRGSPEPFIKLLSEQWDNWLQQCAKQTGCKHIELSKGKFIGNCNELIGGLKYWNN